jgi:AcrR family transcriptional regulator
MDSLRDKQRERRRRDILDAAWTLIGEKGLDSTSIEEIAARAEVGTATVYNYFGSKSDLLQTLFVRYIEEEAERGETALQNPPEVMTDGMVALFGTYLEGLASRCTPILLREFYVLAVSRQFDYGRQTYELKQRFLQQGFELATYYKQRGQLSDDVSAEEAAVMCYSAVTFPFSLFALGLGAPGIDLDTARTLLRRYLTLVITGIGPQTTQGAATQHHA